MGYKKISKTKKGRSQDRKRISLTTKHERDYLKKIAKCKGLLKFLEKEK